MKCPNCRCVIPQRMVYCGYCGYKLPDGTEKTLAVDESDSSDMIFSQNIYTENDGYFYNGHSHYSEQKKDYSDCGGSPQHIVQVHTITNDMLCILLAGLCIAALLLVLALLVLLL